MQSVYKKLSFNKSFFEEWWRPFMIYVLCKMLKDNTNIKQQVIVCFSAVEQVQIFSLNVYDWLLLYNWERYILHFKLFLIFTSMQTFGESLIFKLLTIWKFTWTITFTYMVFTVSAVCALSL